MAKRRRQPAKPKRGRPEIPPNERMGYRVMVRMTDAMGAKLARRAKDMNTTESALARRFLEFGVDHLALIIANVRE